MLPYVFVPVTIPSPAEVGLPSKFSRWRVGQEEAVNVMITSPKRVVALCMPTGTGKSPAYVAAALQSKLPTCIVTSSKGLQKQLMDDFAEIGMVDIRGRRNYKCEMHPDDPEYTCEQGYAAICPYKGTPGCACSAAEFAAARSSLVVTNYAKWTSARKFGQGMDHFQQVIFDEAHNMYDALSDSMQVILNDREINDTLKLDFPTHPEADDFAVWRTWAQLARAVAESEMMQAKARITGVREPKPGHVRHYTHMRNLCKRLATLSTARVDGWVVEELLKGYQFDPIQPGRYVEAALLFHVPRVLCLSATLRPKSLYICGIGKENFHFQEFDSDFDPARCPIYYIPTMRVDDRNKGSLPLLWAMGDRIMSKRTDRKGIIQTTSYEYQRLAKEGLRFSGSIISIDKGATSEQKESLIEKFKAAGPGTTLISPGIGEGYDFAGDLCRWNWILKIPLEPPSKVQKAREAHDKEYRSYRATQKMQQQFGRDVRSNTDWSERFIGDEHMGWFAPRNAHLFTRSFRGFFKEMQVLPQPPKLESM